MTDKQAKRVEVLTRIDELDQLESRTTDRGLLEYIAERKKALRETLNKL